MIQRLELKLTGGSMEVWKSLSDRFEELTIENNCSLASVEWTPEDHKIVYIEFGHEHDMLSTFKACQDMARDNGLVNELVSTKTIKCHDSIQEIKELLTLAKVSVKEIRACTCGCDEEAA